LKEVAAYGQRVKKAVLQISREIGGPSWMVEEREGFQTKAVTRGRR